MSAPDALRDPRRGETDRAGRLALWLMARRKIVLLVAAVLGVFAGWRTALTYFDLRTEIEELLPANAPSVRALSVMRSRLPGVRYMGVVVDTGGPGNVEAANRFLDDLAARLERYPKDLVGTVRTGVKSERQFAETYVFQLLEVDDIRKLREAIERRRDWEVTRATGTDLLDESDDPKPELPFDELRSKYEKRFGQTKPFPNDRFVSSNGMTSLLLVQATTHETGIEKDRQLIARIRADVASLGFPERYARGMRTGLSSDVPTRVEEMEGLMSDLSISGLLVLLLVLGGIAVYFRSLRAVLILGVPLTWGTFYSFALAALPPFSITHLNSNTAFLGSIIVGNGINSGIIVLARFREERDRGALLEAAAATALSTTWRATLAASSAAAVAYGSLVLTDFRGFNRFGWIGGIGMLVCWAMTMLLIPPMLGVIGERLPRARQTARVGHGMFQRLMLWLFAHPRSVLAVTGLAVVIGAAGLVHRAGSWIEYDLSKLRRRDAAVSGALYWDGRLDATLERYLDPTLVLSDDAAEAHTVAARVRKLAEQGGGGGLIDSVRSAEDVLLPNREQAVEEAKRLKAVITPRMRAELSADDRQLLDRALSEKSLTPLRAEDIPETLVAGLRENDGRIDRSVLVFPKLSSGTWNAKRLDEYADDLRRAASFEGHQISVIGPLLLTSDIATAMQIDGPRATLLSLIAVLLICIVAFRSFGLSIAAVASLLVGVLVMLGVLGWSGTKLNFSNFVALPITFGIGADYSVNMLKRFQIEGKRDLRAALASTGGAVALCSYTTIAGYGSLLLAQNRALFSFGVMAVAGEIFCLATAIIALPCALTLFFRRAPRPTPAPAEEERPAPSSSEGLRSRP